MQTVHELIFPEDTESIPQTSKLALIKSVEKGSVFLNSQCIPWQEYVSEGDFDMCHPQRCILAKQFGTFTEGYYRMGWGPTSREGLGAFSHAIEMGLFSYNREHMHYLTVLWQRMASLKQTFVN